MYYLIKRSPIRGKRDAKAELRCFSDYGASIHQRAGSPYYDLLIPLDQNNVDRLVRGYQRTHPNLFQLVNVTNFDITGAVIFSIVGSKKEDLDDG